MTLRRQSLYADVSVVLLELRLLRPWPLTSATAKTNQGWNVDYTIVFRTAAGASTPAVVIGQAFTQTSGGTQSQGSVATNVNMTVARDLVIDATWSAATATNIIRCESFTIEKVF
jgi:hypothetical protein